MEHQDTSYFAEKRAEEELYTSYIAGKKVEEELWNAIRNFRQFVDDEFYSGANTEKLSEALKTIKQAARILSDYNFDKGFAFIKAKGGRLMR